MFILPFFFFVYLQRMRCVLCERTKSGQIVIPCTWNLANSFNEGQAHVKDTNGNWVYIDHTGNIVK